MDTPLGTSAGRQKTLQALEEQTELAPINEPTSINNLVDAVNDIAVPRVLSPPQKIVEQIDEIHTGLPEDAQPHYVSDDRLLRHINAARRQFNDWMGKRRRMAKMPSPVETGRANYPTRSAQKRSRLEQEAREELEAKLDQAQSTARGAEQRALNAIGSSVGEQTDQRREQQRNELRERLSAGAFVKFRNPQLRAGRVIRVNKKSVRVQYPNPRAGTTCPVTGEKEPNEREDRVQLDSEYLEMLDAETIDEAVAAIDEMEPRG